ncbi:hypothetical protein F511_23562 [Dorcoceras hygrometricum]|uniref:Uncharacterized protein n=1 Tax=Dorcoceras hygrometricum TaxID=472368 RepID=A0A2Z7CIV4_9LAMI|nr:hypothetical protein F511_23562 [Dorcoceras hygrometricum]
MQNTVARDWVHCSLRLVDQLVKICLQLVVQTLVVKCLRLDYPTTACVWVYKLPARYYHRNKNLLNLSAKAKRCRIHLSKRHRFAIANFKYQLLVVL